MTNAIAVPDQEHPDHQLGIDRGPADVAVKCLQLLVQIGQNGCREHIAPSQQVVHRNHLVEVKLVKQLSLISVLPPHHRRFSCRSLSRNHCSLGFSSPFFDSIDTQQTSGPGAQIAIVTLSLASISYMRLTNGRFVMVPVVPSMDESGFEKSPACAPRAQLGTCHDT